MTGKVEVLVLLLVRWSRIGDIGNIESSLAFSSFYLSISSCFFGMNLLSKMGCLRGGGMW